MDASSLRIEALEKLVRKCEQSCADLAAIQEELRTLRVTETLREALRLNTETLDGAHRMLNMAMARQRLDRERQLVQSKTEASPVLR